MFSEYPVYCINIFERTDRKDHVINEFNKIGIDSSKVVFPIFNRDVRGGIYGCYDSHVKIWNDFYQNSNCNYLLVFEDDFVVNDICKNILEKGAEFMQNNYNSVDFLFLHNYCVELPSSLNNNNFVRGFGSDTHSYFISRNYINTLINNFYFNWLIADGFDIDLSINYNRSHMLHSEKIYYTKQSAFKQLEPWISKSDNVHTWISKSDNVNSFLDNITRLPILKYMNKMNLQFYLLFLTEQQVKDLYFEKMKQTLNND
jgi:GR25 family glycosyltransferase involved in LPS biosynthesis